VTQIARVAQLIRDEAGISFRPAQEIFLESALGRAFPDTPDPSAFLRRVDDPAGGRRAVAQLLEEVTINETFFFREREQLEAIPWHVLSTRAAARGDRAIRIWCAACSTGEEPYSVAMLAWNAFGGSVPPVEILATDISTTALARAAEACYGGRSLRAVDALTRARYFSQEDGGAVVNERVRRLVRFTQANLISELPLETAQRFDAIVCRNVLIYFEPATVARVVTTLEGMLHPAGHLILGSADALCATADRAARTPVAQEPPPALPRQPRRRPSEPATTSEELFGRATLELGSGQAAAATETLAQALSMDPSFGLAAFQLARAHEACGNRRAARREYVRALRLLERHGAGRHERLLAQLDVADVVAACQARLTVKRERH
jgi:chemotaxis methyl-accepting protein methylase